MSAVVFSTIPLFNLTRLFHSSAVLTMLFHSLVLQPSQLPPGELVVVSKYVENPLCIDGECYYSLAQLIHILTCFLGCKSIARSHGVYKSA